MISKENRDTSQPEGGRMFVLPMEKPIIITSFSTKLAHTYMIFKLYVVCH
jgi:hypothetical protein